MRGTGRITVGQWLDEWLETYVVPKMRDGELAASTVTSYSGHVRRYLKPELGDIGLRKLRPEHVTALYLRLGAPRTEGGYGLSVRTRELTHSTLRCALAKAESLGRVPRNILAKGAGVDRPRVPRQTVRALEEAEAVTLMSLLTAEGPEHRLFLPAALALATGMRRGEILALRLEDIVLPPAEDTLGLGLITVRRTWDKSADPQRGRAPVERYRIKHWPKSGRERYVDLAPEVVAVLREAIREREARRLAAGSSWATRAVREDGTVIEWGELLICGSDGSPWWPDSFSSRWKVWCEANDVHCRFHDLRATSGSLSLAAGVDPEVVRSRLGHHSAAFFLERYARPMRTAQRRDAAIMGTLVERAVSGASRGGAERDEEPLSGP